MAMNLRISQEMKSNSENQGYFLSPLKNSLHGQNFPFLPHCPDCSDPLSSVNVNLYHPASKTILAFLSSISTYRTSMLSTTLVDAFAHRSCWIEKTTPSREEVPILRQQAVPRLRSQDLRPSRCTIKSATSAGVIPLMRPAWAKLPGRSIASFSLASFRSDPMLA